MRGVQVVGCYQRALELNFSNAILLINLGEALESLHKYDQVGGTCDDLQSALALLVLCSHGAHVLFSYTARLLGHRTHVDSTSLSRCLYTALNTAFTLLARCW